MDKAKEEEETEEDTFAVLQIQGCRVMGTEGSEICKLKVQVVCESVCRIIVCSFFFRLQIKLV